MSRRREILVEDGLKFGLRGRSVEREGGGSGENDKTELEKRGRNEIVRVERTSQEDAVEFC